LGVLFSLMRAMDRRVNHFSRFPNKVWPESFLETDYHFPPVLRLESSNRLINRFLGCCLSDLGGECKSIITLERPWKFNCRNDLLVEYLSYFQRLFLSEWKGLNPLGEGIH
jgi:hypothetical protein